MPIGIDDVLARAKKCKARIVDLRYCDLVGACHHVTIPIGGLTKQIFETGVPFDSSSVAGFKTLEGGDMVLVPDPNTALLDPFYQAPTLALTCWIRESGTLETFPRDPRLIAARAESFLASTGIADRSLWGPEFEFYIFDHISSVNQSNQAGYRIEVQEAHWNTGEEVDHHLGARIRYQSGYHAMPPLDSQHDLRSLMLENIEAAGITTRYHHHEVGGAGQCEIEIDFLPLLQAADAVMLVKYLVKMTARQAGKTATFMAKPLTNEAGNGMHFHQLLFKDKLPVFHDANGYAGLSQTARYYIGGILSHSPALLALTNPSTNSYKRLTPGFEAPTRIFFGLANRSATVRIPKQVRGPGETRFEFRPPDASCNPYLAMAAQLLAGIDGIQKKLDPTELGFGPFDFNVFNLSDGEREKIKSVPASLEEALEALQRDHQFLLPGKVFPEDFVKVWVKHKMQHDVIPVRNRTHPFELELYYDV